MFKVHAVKITCISSLQLATMQGIIMSDSQGFITLGGGGGGGGGGIDCMTIGHSEGEGDVPPPA